MNHKASSCHLSRGLPKAKIFGKSSAEACLSLAFKSSEIQSQIFGQRCVLVFYEKRQEAAVNHEASSCHLSRGLPKAKILGLSWSVSIFVLQLRRLKFNVIYLSKFAKTCFFLKRDCCESWGLLMPFNQWSTKHPTNSNIFLTKYSAMDKNIAIHIAEDCTIHRYLNGFIKNQLACLKISFF